MEITKEYLAAMLEAAVRDKITATAKVEQSNGVILAIQALQRRLAEQEETEKKE